MKKPNLITYQKIPENNSEKFEVNFCFGWNSVPKNTPKWLIDIWETGHHLWQKIPITFDQVKELYNVFELDIMLSHSSECEIVIAINDAGKRFGQR